MIEKTCTACGATGPAIEFAPKRRICKRCRSQYASEWKRANPDKVAASRLRTAASDAIREQRRKASRKGIDPEIVAEYRAAHHGGCDICGGINSLVKDLAIDHNHKTGQFRGMLCDNCNQGLRRFKDDPRRPVAAIKYLGVSPGDLYDLIEEQKRGRLRDSSVR